MQKLRDVGGNGCWAPIVLKNSTVDRALMP
jgi:hypothetical protein